MRCVWSLCQETALHFHCWDDGAVVFDQSSGGTHHIGPLAVELLIALEQTPKMSSQALLDEFSDVFTDSEDGLATIDDALSQLEALGLVKRIDG